MFAKAVVRQGLLVAKGKAQVTLRIDSDALEWFKSQGRGYPTQINGLETLGEAIAILEGRNLMNPIVTQMGLRGLGNAVNHCSAGFLS